jgi:hypothetical protein
MFAQPEGRVKRVVEPGRAYPHGNPPVELKCVSQKRWREMAGLLGGEQARRRTVLQSAGYAIARPVL